ncbi:MAG TPA: hypothetical protein V6D05_16585, partial [Stenomitos sp.]
MRVAVLMVGLLLAAAPVLAAPPTPLEAPAQQSYVLRGVVGQSISVALPNRQGYSWQWEAPGKALFAPPYKVSYQSLSSPEIWTFPLVRPGTVTLSFKLLAAGAEKPAEVRMVELQVLTPYEAQQHP